MCVNNHLMSLKSDEWLMTLKSSEKIVRNLFFFFFMCIIKYNSFGSLLTEDY